jgi:hypothetical protein
MDPRMLMSAGQNPSSVAGDIGSFFTNLFSDPGAGYKKASDILSQYLPQAQSYLNPFVQAGQGAIPNFQNWLQSMKDPSEFINNLMGKYQQSPYAKFMQQQGVRTAQNLGSASGLTGSTPLTQFAEQNAENISSQDMQNWLSRVLGINTQYGQGEFGLMGQGLQAGNSLTNLMQNFMNNQAELGYGEEAAKQGRTGSLIQSIANLF